MYRCTECNSMYEIRPEFCECGNDQFVEVDAAETQQYAQEDYSQDATPSSIFEQNSMQPEPQYEEQEERFSFDASIVKKKKITIMMFAISVIVTLLLMIFVGNEPPRVKADPEQEAAKKERLAQLAETIPDVSAFWDDTPAYGSSSQKSSLPLLNNNLGNLSPEMKKYMISVGHDFSTNWTNKNLVQGEGICKIEFTINKDGTINKSKIIEKSENESLNDSVSMVLTRVSNVDAPPSDYKGERIHLSFQVGSNGKFKIYYP